MELIELDTKSSFKKFSPGSESRRVIMLKLGVFFMKSESCLFKLAQYSDREKHTESGKWKLNIM